MACPAEGAALTVRVNNPTGAFQTLAVSGTVVAAACSGGAISYGATVTCAPGISDCFSVSGLAAGIWKHQIAAGVQRQYAKSILVAGDPNGIANTIAWTTFVTVITVDRMDDVTANPVPRCPSLPGTRTCTLRQAMAHGGSAAPPLLIQFDPSVFPAGKPTAIQLASSGSLPIAGAGMVIDGTDPNGDPTFRGDPWSRIVSLPSSGATFVFSNRDALLTGLALQRPLLANGAAPEDVIRFEGGSGETEQDVVATCKIDGGGEALTVKSSGHDCVEGVGGAGLDWADANLVRDSEITGCPDKGVKVTTLAYLSVRDSWLHHNIGGGIQATFSGNVDAERNVIEHSGYNATAQVFLDANGLSANGANTIVGSTTPSTPSVLRTSANIVRDNSSRGISVQELSNAALTNDFSCGALNGATGSQNGIAIYNNTASVAFAEVRGVASVYNGRNGATVADQSQADFGGNGLAGGDNAFTQNATTPALGGHNLDNSSSAAVQASGDQWQHCYADPSHPSSACDGPLGLDVSGAVIVAPPQPYRSDGTALPIVIERFTPAKAKAGDLVHITGHGFNAIDGYPAGGNCTTTVQRSNSCNPIAGTCVQYEASPGEWIDVPVHAVTPREIAVQMPVTCAQPVAVRVLRRDDTGAIVSGSKTFCTNSP
jgi:hypothetical protein